MDDVLEREEPYLLCRSLVSEKAQAINRLYVGQS